MSKAFVKDDAVTEEVAYHQMNLIPSGENYVTRGGLEFLKRELASEPDSSPRAQFLKEQIRSAHVIVPEEQSGSRVLFGATVEVRDEDGHLRTYKIVGVPETNLKQGKISWISPIGKALLQKCVGDVAVVQTPRGEEELEVMSVKFIPIE